MELTKEYLYRQSVLNVEEFCNLNGIEIPRITLAKINSRGVYFIKNKDIKLNLSNCNVPCNERAKYNWSYPGYKIDATPYGVVMHEFGHYIDFKFNLSCNLRKLTKEKKLTNYCPNTREWFAEHFRLYMTNNHLHKCLAPKLNAELNKLFKPLKLEVIGTPPIKIQNILDRYK